MKVADQRVAAPARPDLREGNGREDADGDVLPVGVVERQSSGRNGQGAAGGDALFVQRIARRPAAPGALGPAVAVSADIGRHQLGRKRQQRIRLQPARRRARRGQRPLQARRKAPSAVSAAGPGNAVRQAVTNTR